MSVEEVEEEQTQLIKEINDIKPIKLRVSKHKKLILNSVGAFL